MAGAPIRSAKSMNPWRLASLRGWGRRVNACAGSPRMAHWRARTFLGALRYNRLAAPVSDGSKSREPENAFEALRDRSEGHRQMAEAVLRCEPSDWPERAEIDGAIRRGGGRYRRFPPHEFTAKDARPAISHRKTTATEALARRYEEVRMLSQRGRIAAAGGLPRYH